MSQISIPEEYIKAGKIAGGVRESIRKGSLVGMSLLEICNEVEGMFRKKGSEPAFPCCSSVNNTAAHYSAILDEEYVVKEGDIIKLDIGCHLNGYLVDTAVTISYNSEFDSLVQATEASLNAAIKAAKEGVPAGYIGKVIEEVAENWGFKTISNLSGHSIERYKVHAGISIPNVWTPANQMLKANTVYAIEPFLTVPNGAGYVVEGKAKPIYALLTRKKTGDKRLDSFADMIWETRRILPFSPRWYRDQYPKEELRKVLDRLVKIKVLRAYPDLIEARGGYVAQFEHTIVPTPTGAVVLTQV